MDGDTLIDSDSGSFDSFTFIPKDQPLFTASATTSSTMLTKKRPASTAVENEDDEGTASPASSASSSSSSSSQASTSSASSLTPSSAASTSSSASSASSAASSLASAPADKKRRKVSFAEDLPTRHGTEAEASSDASSERKLSQAEIEEMKRKAEQWWSLPSTTTQEEFEETLRNFKEQPYFKKHLEVEWLDVLLARASARFVGLPQFSEPVQELCSALHAAITRNNKEEIDKLTHGDTEIIDLVQQYQEQSKLMADERQRLTERFGLIHSAKIAIKSEVYVCSATRLRQAGKEVTDQAVEEELAAFERGQVTVPGSKPSGGCIMGMARAPPSHCPVVHDDNGDQPAQTTPSAVPPGVCPFSGLRKQAE